MLTASFSSFDPRNSSVAPMQEDHTAQVAEKVMRRIEIAKVARNLHDCLAFASFKAQNGWQDRTLSTIEPEITEKLARRKRPYPEDLNPSESSSNLSDDFASSISQPIQSRSQPRKRVRACSSLGAGVTAFDHEWRSNNPLSQASPVLATPDTDVRSLPLLEDSPMFDAPSASEDEDQDCGGRAGDPPSSSIRSSSPPRTPPPAGRRNLTNTKHAGAELFAYLTDTPQTPAIHIHEISSSSKNPPTTPPHQYGNLPSSVMRTPGTLGLFNGALQTPGNFNLADFCNVTPSPADAQLRYIGQDTSRTPTRITRRSLNFDTLAPPSPISHRK